MHGNALWIQQPFHSLHLYIFAFNYLQCLKLKNNIFFVLFFPFSNALDSVAAIVECWILGTWVLGWLSLQYVFKWFFSNIYNLIAVAINMSACAFIHFYRVYRLSVLSWLDLGCKVSNGTENPVKNVLSLASLNYTTNIFARLCHLISKCLRVFRFPSFFFHHLILLPFFSM